MIASETLDVHEVAQADDPLLCLCGIPHCQGHEVVDGYAIFIQNHPALEASGT